MDPILTTNAMVREWGQGFPPVTINLREFCLERKLDWCKILFSKRYGFERMRGIRDSFGNILEVGGEIKREGELRCGKFNCWLYNFRGEDVFGYIGCDLIVKMKPLLN